MISIGILSEMINKVVVIIMIDLLSKFVPFLYDKTYEIIEYGAVRREFIQIPKELRGIGKTTALIRLAKKYNLIVVVASQVIADFLKVKFEYPKIYSQGNLENLRGSKDKKIVFDEGVDVNNLKGFEIVTGIVYS
jgi:hypothetical protein